MMPIETPMTDADLADAITRIGAIRAAMRRELDPLDPPDEPGGFRAVSEHLELLLSVQRQRALLAVTPRD